MSNSGASSFCSLRLDSVVPDLCVLMPVEGLGSCYLIARLVHPFFRAALFSRVVPLPLVLAASVARGRELPPSTIHALLPGRGWPHRFCM